MAFSPYFSQGAATGEIILHSEQDTLAYSLSRMAGEVWEDYILAKSTPY